MSNVDEFEEYRSRAYSAGHYDMPRGHGAHSLPSTPKLPKNNGQLGASFKSEGSYRAYRAAHLLAQKLAEVRLAAACDSAPEVTEVATQRQPHLMERFGSASDDGDEEDSPSPEMEQLGARMLLNPLRHPQHPPLGRLSNSPAGLSAHYGNAATPSPPPVAGTPTSHHHRSLSCRQRVQRPRDLTLQEMTQEPRRRTYSMPTRNKYRRPRLHPPPEDSSNMQPSTAEGDEFYRLRTFSTSKQGIVNRGDSFKRKTLSAQSSADPFRPRTWSNTSQGSSVGSVASSVPDSPVLRKCLVIGSSGVGKTSLVQQFMTSECMGNTDSPFDDEPRQSVSVLVDGDEADLEFVDTPPMDEIANEKMADAYVIVYAVNERETFDEAVECLHELKKSGLGQQVAVILVANKGDIVRGRVVEEEEGKVMAGRYDCKYIEVSAVLNIKVDELLVGIVKQVRLKEQRKQQGGKKKPSKLVTCLPDDNGCLPQPRGLVGKLFKRSPYMVRSCDNLLVL